MVVVWQMVDAEAWDNSYQQSQAVQMEKAVKLAHCHK